MTTKSKPSKSRSGKPICYACHRPFDPASPGATRTMGPTCAKRFSAGTSAAGSSCDSIDVVYQLDLNFTDERVANPRTLARSYRMPKSSIPARIVEKSEAAKAAFDDLRREFTRANSAFYGPNARELFEGLRREPLERHALNDPSLEWLTPDYDLHLFIDRATGRAYCWRVFNKMETLLLIDTRTSTSARVAIETIRDFSLSLGEYRRREGETQLTFSAGLLECGS